MTATLEPVREIVSERDLRDLLPHRAPMLLVDRVTEIVPRRSVRAVKAVTRAEAWLAGGDVLPAVLLIESWCQSAGLIATWSDPNPDVRAGQVMLFASITDIRLGAPVGPGSLVVHEAQVVRDFGDTLVFAGRATCDGRTVLEVGSVTVAFRPAEVLAPPPDALHGTGRRPASADPPRRTRTTPTARTTPDRSREQP